MSPDTANLKPQITSSSIELPTLKDNVTIRRDGRGVPYIEALNDEDLYFAQGYATACDRLWQMDFLRRTARGELSEILGPAALEQDKLHRVYGFTKLAERLLERASTQTRAVLESYARGVNAFIEACGATSLPPEFHVLRYAPREWTAVDSLALGKLLAESLSVTVDVDILRALLVDLPPEKLDALLPETSPLDVIIVGNDVRGRNRLTPPEGDNVSDRAKVSEVEVAALTSLLTAMRRSRAASGGDSQVGSNSWVVSGRLTSSGKPMLANDPHLPPTSPPIWYITHLSAPDLQVSGVSLPGLPGVMIGHNERVAWGITNLCPDVQDLYFEKFDENDPCSYKTPAGWQRAEVRREEIGVRQSSDGSSSEIVTLDVKETRHGPVIFENGSLGLSLRWTALDAEVIDLDTFLALNRARKWDEFVAALSGFGGPPQNFVYADTDGHIGYYAAGRIPLRRTGDGSLPYDGTTDAGEWLGFIPFQELPHVFDPPSGIIVTANNRLAGHDYPHHLTHNWRVPYRARRIYELLTTKRNLTTADFLSIQGDTYSYPDVIFTSEVVKLAEPLTSTSAEWREMVDAFEGWDGYSNSESTVVPLVTEMRKAFRRHILVGALGVERAQLFEWRNEGTFIDKLITERPAAWLPEGFASYESLVLACYREARDRLSNQLGSDQAHWTWGKLASVRFPHPLEKMGSIGSRFAGSTFPQNTGGSMPTVNAGARVSMRFIADLSDWAHTRLCIPLGESGDPSSVHRDDQFADWRNVTPRVLPFSQNSIADATRNILMMSPPSK
jgi:penicillin amidase